MCSDSICGGGQCVVTTCGGGQCVVTVLAVEVSVW